MGKPVIAIAGAGSIGSYLGTVLAHQGEQVVFLGRPWLLNEVTEYGLTATDHEGRLAHLSPPKVTASDDPSLLGQADIILVTVKSADTAAIADQIARHAKADAVVVSLQNGVRNADILREALPGRRVVAGMVPYNVVSLGRGQFRRATAGNIALERAGADLVPILSAPDHPIDLSDDIVAVQWGKLLMNLNNALNALSNKPLRDQLTDYSWRRVLATMQSEALKAMKAAGIHPKPASPIPPQFMPWMLRLPTPLFKLIAAKTLKIDEGARSSMWEDLERHRKTEIDALQGEIVQLAAEMGTDAKTCARVMAAIKQAEADAQGSPGINPAQLMT